MFFTFHLKSSREQQYLFLYVSETPVQAEEVAPPQPEREKENQNPANESPTPGKVTASPGGNSCLRLFTKLISCK